MVRDSVRSVRSSFFVLRSFFVRHTSIQNNVNGGVESLVTKGRTLVTKEKDLGDQRETLGDQKETLGDIKNDLDDQRKDLNESKAAMPQIVKQTG